SPARQETQLLASSGEVEWPPCSVSGSGDPSAKRKPCHANATRVRALDHYPSGQLPPRRGGSAGGNGTAPGSDRRARRLVVPVHPQPGTAGILPVILARGVQGTRGLE